jgi:hypothetical protein
MEAPLRNFPEIAGVLAGSRTNHLPFTNLNRSHCANLIDFPVEVYIIVTYMWCVTIDGVRIGEWIYWPLTPHDSELQVITAPPLISTSPAKSYLSPLCLH